VSCPILQANYFAVLSPAQNVHTSCDASTASGNAIAFLKNNMFCYYLSTSGLVETASHIHGPAAVNTNAAVLYTLPKGTIKRQCVKFTKTQVTQLNAGMLYFNVHSGNFKGGCANGEMRGQIYRSA
jgi:hypothetical protein